MVHIYILELENGKYYVGKTNDPNFRINEHFNSNGSAWTHRYKPLRVLKIIPNCDDYDEDKYTKMYMDKFGVDNVRGGSYVQMKMDKSTKDSLERMSRGTNDACFKCGEIDHFAGSCHVGNKKIHKPAKQNVRCFRCGRIGHYVDDCYVSTYVDGNKILKRDGEDYYYIEKCDDEGI